MRPGWQRLVIRADTRGRRADSVGGLAYRATRANEARRA